MFSMFGAPVQRVELACDAGMIGPMLDRFGVEATVVPQPGGGFTLYADVAVSPPFSDGCAGLAARCASPGRTPCGGSFGRTGKDPRGAGNECTKSRSGFTSLLLFVR